MLHICRFSHPGVNCTFSTDLDDTSWLMISDCDGAAIRVDQQGGVGAGVVVPLGARHRGSVGVRTGLTAQHQSRLAITQAEGGQELQTGDDSWLKEILGDKDIYKESLDFIAF